MILGREYEIPLRIAHLNFHTWPTSHFGSFYRSTITKVIAKINFVNKFVKGWCVQHQLRKERLRLSQLVKQDQNAGYHILLF